MAVSISFQDFYLLAPELTLVLLGFLVLALGLIFPRLYSEALLAIVLIGFAVSLLFATQHWAGDSATAFYGMITVDKFAVGFQCLFIISAGLTLMLSLNALEEKYLLYSEYFALIIFATVGMMLMASSAHLLTLFLGLETLSISLYILAGFRRTDAKALEASFKYFLLGAFASGFLLYGIALIYGSAGSANLTALAETVARRLSTEPASTPDSGTFRWPSLFITGLVLMVIGFGFKIALAPFHTWAPDVYQGAPTPISAFMATGSKAAGFAALLRLLLASGIMAEPIWQQIFWAIAVATMTIGNIIALRQENIKRMLAYSSIAHAGYILIGAIANNENGHAGTLFYLLSYTFMNIGAFGVVALLAKPEQEYVNISEYRGLAYRRPFAALAMAIFMFSLSGIPPTAGFLAKFYVFSGAVQAGYIWLVIFGVINSMISLYYYLGIVVAMFMQEPEGEKKPVTPLPAVVIALGIAVFATLNLGLFPGQWMDKFQALARSLM